MKRTLPTLRNVYITGYGLLPVTRKGDTTSLEGMGNEAVRLALHNAQCDPAAVEGIYVGNMLSGMLSQQQHLGPLIGSKVGIRGDAMTIESCCGAGGGALRLGYMAVKSGVVETAVVVGVEHMTHRPVPETTAALATASHWGNEGGKGETFVTLNGALHRAYTAKYNVGEFALAPFSLNAHKNAVTAQHATLQKSVSLKDYEASRVVSPPIRVLDASPICDGAAAVVISATKPANRGCVEVLASAAASDILTVSERPDPLELKAVKVSTEKALRQAAVERRDISIFELHDAYSIMACLSLEAAGFAPPGEGWSLARDGLIALDSVIPLSTFGGLKARGHPVGATGVYQAVEACMQLHNAAGTNQVLNPKLVMTQNIGGAGSSVFTHIFSAA